MRRTRRTFTPEFKLQIVKLYESGKKRKDILEEYDLTPSAFNKWVKDYRTTGSFNHKDNMSDAELEIAALRKKLKQLEMENDILKQAALIMGQK